MRQPIRPGKPVRAVDNIQVAVAIDVGHRAAFVGAHNQLALGEFDAACSDFLGYDKITMEL